MFSILSVHQLSDLQVCRVKHRSHRIFVSIQHQAPAFLNENYPIAIEVTNADDKDLEVVLDVLLQPTDVDSASKLFG